MRVFIPILMVALASAALPGCYSSTTTESQHIDVSQIYQTYSIHIDHDEGMAECEAIFTITDRAGNKVALNPPASVSVNGQPMEASNEWGTSYWAGMDPIASNYTFVYTDRDGKAYTNTVNVPMMSMPEFPDVISPDDKLSLGGWKDFGQFVSLSLMIQDSLEEMVSLSVSDYFGENELSLQELDKLAAGPLTITLIYIGETPLQNATAVGGENMVYTVYGLIKGVTLAKRL